MSSSQLPKGRHSFRRALHSPLPPEIRDMLCESASPSVSSALGETKDDRDEEIYNVAGPSRPLFRLSPVHVTEAVKDVEDLDFTRSPLQGPSELLALELSPSADDDDSKLDGSGFSDSFWSRRDPDTSTSWDVTHHDDSLDLPVPLLSRDGKWRGRLVLQSSGSDVTLEEELLQPPVAEQSQSQGGATEEKDSISSQALSPKADSNQESAKLAGKRPSRSSLLTASTYVGSSLTDPESRHPEGQETISREHNNALPLSVKVSLDTPSKAPSGRYALRSRKGLSAHEHERHKRDDHAESQSNRHARAGTTRPEELQSTSGRPVRSSSHRQTIDEGDGVREKSQPRWKTFESRKRACLPAFSVRQNPSDKLSVVRQLTPTTIRSFPTGFPFHRGFPLFYQRYYPSTCVDEAQLRLLLPDDDSERLLREDPEMRTIAQKAENRDANSLNEIKSLLDLYTPRIVRGAGLRKEGMCPICYEDDSERFFSMKNSAYNYHLQNAHGISASTCLPFTPPIDFATEPRPRAKPKERSEMIRGLCHVCNRYVDLQGPRAGDVKVPEIYWWKHAQSCHRAHGPPQGFNGFFMPNAWFKCIRALLDRTIGYDGEIDRLLAS